MAANVSASSRCNPLKLLASTAFPPAWYARFNLHFGTCRPSYVLLLLLNCNVPCTSGCS
jgi:hypothetical protein